VKSFSLYTQPAVKKHLEALVFFLIIILLLIFVVEEKSEERRMLARFSPSQHLKL